MIIDTIRLYSDLIDVTGANVFVDFPVTSLAGENGYILKATDGFDPSDNYLFVEGFDSAGIPINDPIPQGKELVLATNFVPGPAGSVSSLRDALYKLISRPVKVQLMYNNGVVMFVEGAIRKLESPYSVNDPDAKLTIVCEDGLFKSPTQIVVPTGALSKSAPVIDYTLGTAPAGFIFNIVLTGNMTGFTLSGVSGGHAWSLGVTGSFFTGDTIIFNTSRLERSITRIRSAVTTDQTGLIAVGSIWPRLHPGRNTFATSSSAFNWGSVTYYPRFWGM